MHKIKKNNLREFLNEFLNDKKGNIVFRNH